MERIVLGIILIAIGIGTLLFRKQFTDVVINFQNEFFDMGFDEKVRKRTANIGVPLISTITILFGISMLLNISTGI